jgi:hypothetical protein
MLAKIYRLSFSQKKSLNRNYVIVFRMTWIKIWFWLWNRIFLMWVL